MSGHVHHPTAGHTRTQGQHPLLAEREVPTGPLVLGQLRRIQQVGVQDHVGPEPPDVDRLPDLGGEMANAGGGDQVHG